MLKDVLRPMGSPWEGASLSRQCLEVRKDLQETFRELNTEAGLQDGVVFSVSTREGRVLQAKRTTGQRPHRTQLPT